MKRSIKKLVEIGMALKPLKQDFREFHVCGIFKKNRLISLATNSSKTHRLALKFGYPWADKSIHAETSAIIRGKLEDYSGHDLIVIRIDNNNNLNFSKPCVFCSNLISKFNFDTVIFSNKNGIFEEYKQILIN